MYLGIDLGTSGVKSILIDDDQQLIGSAAAQLEVSRPQSGWSEQDPQTWIDGAKATLMQLRSEFTRQMAAVKGIGLSGQMHGATVIGNDDDVLTPCILWDDTRSHVEASELDAQEQFRDLTGNIVFPGFTAPKLLWMKRHQPDVFNKIKKILLPKDFLRLWLTGEYCSDMSDASGTSWLDVGKRRWSKDLLTACDLSIEQMPDLVEGSQASGTVRSELASEFGFTNKVIVAGGAGDNAASAIATGTVQSGSAFVSLGTSGVVFAANDTYLPNPASAVHAFCHAIPEHWHQMGVILSATAALNWYSSIVGMSAQALTEELGGVLAEPTGALFLPYLAGERTPHNDAQVRGSFHGLGSEMNRANITQAVLEGVAYALRDNLEALEQAGTTLTELTAQGGGSNSLYWLKVIATVLGVPIHVPIDGDFGAAFGAARLGMLASTGSAPQDVCTAPVISKTIEPESSMRGAFDDAYLRYKDCYRSDE